MQKLNCFQQMQQTLTTSIRIMTRRRKTFHTFNEWQHYAFDCLFVSWLFTSIEFTFLKDVVTKQALNKSDHFKNIKVINPTLQEV